MDAERWQKLRLVIAGTGNSRIFGGERGAVEGVIHTGRVTDGELRALYENAACFVLPSLYEGFGLPLLEAMALGCAALSSNRASLPEVGGDAAVYFNPEDTEEMEDALARVLLDADLRGRLAQQGMRWARRFRWQETARLTWATLLEASGGNQGQRAA
jgi:glycosyltransferase involved in cell wall biosynthesis